MASHPRSFIHQPTDVDMKAFPEEVKHLVKKGREQRYVTHQEVLRAVPNAEENIDLLDGVYTLFMDLGIDVIDVKDTLIWQRKSKGESVQQQDGETAGGAITAADSDDESLEVVATAGIRIKDEKQNALEIGRAHV